MYYLTWEARADYNDLHNSSVRGRLGSYIRVFMSASTLAKSPYFTQEKIESYPDYSADWNVFLTRVQAASTHTTHAGLKALNQLETAVHPSAFKTLIGQFNLTVNPGQAALLSASDEEDSEDSEADDEQPLVTLVEEPSTSSKKKTRKRTATAPAVVAGHDSWQDVTHGKKKKNSKE